MTEYRLYMLNPLGRIQARLDLDCADDETAIAAAHARVPDELIEIWQGKRMVHRCPRLDESRPSTRAAS
jgi:hypothetical protein